MEPIDILMTTYLRREITEKVILELHKRTKRPYRLLVIDNGSWDGTRDMLKNLYPEYIDVLFLLDNNLGLERARNFLLPLMQSKYVIFSDNDIMPQDSDPDWLTQLINLFERRKDEYGAIALRPQVMVGSGNVFEKCDDEILGFPAAGYLRISEKEDILKMGGWRNDFVNNGLGHEENYMKDKFKEVLNKKVGYAKDIRAWHFFSDGNWGYPDGVTAGHRPIWPMPKDNNFDWQTCIPR